MSDELKKQFEAAAVLIKSLPKRPDNESLLQLYALYKQASVGDVTGERPAGFDFIGGAKFDAWVALKGVDREEAMQRYIAKVESMKS